MWFLFTTFGPLILDLVAKAISPVTGTTVAQQIGQLQAQQQIPTLLAFDQSILLVWPQVVVLVAMTVACFALAYVAFMRQEVRA